MLKSRRLKGITAAKYLYVKFGGHEKVVTAQAQERQAYRIFL